MKRQVMSSLALLAGVLSLTAGARADTGDITLRLKGSEVEFTGALKSFDGRTYVVAAPSFGLLSLDAERYDCEGRSCTSSNGQQPPAAEASLAALDFVSGAAPNVERLTVSGSDTIARELMPALIRDYAKSMGGSVRQLVGANPDETQFKLMDGGGALVSHIDLTRASAGTAFASLSNAKSAIAMSSRPIQAAEVSSLSRLAPNAKVEDYEHVVALDGMAVVVAAENPVKALGIDKLAAIFSGKITNWADAGLPAGPISLYVGAESSGSMDAFSDLVLEPANLSVPASAVRLASEAEIADAVARDPRGIGVTSYAFLRNAKPVGLSGACGLTWQPSEFSIKAEEYPLSRRLYLYTPGAPGAGAAGKLIKYASSSTAQATIAASQFMDQSVVMAPFSEQGTRASDWLAASTAGKFEKDLARNLLDEIKDAKRLSLTFRFALASSALDAKARQDLTRLVDLLQTPELKGKTVMLLGFTDSVGSPERNASLAVRRASEVRDAILGSAPNGVIDAKALVVEGYGAVAPAACNDGAESMNRNRRVEVWIRDRMPAPKVAAAATLDRRPPVARKKRRLR